MRCLIVLAHPLDKSLSRRFAELAKSELEASGHEVSLVDLYAEDFDPRLSKAERATHYGPDHDHSAIAGHAALLREADMLVLVFPTWWFGLPAILKGWLDRVFAPGIAFDQNDAAGPLVPRLDRLRHAVAITTLGASWWIDRLVFWRPVRRVLKTGVIRVCASKARFTWLSLYDAENLMPARLAAFEERIKARLPR